MNHILSILIVSTIFSCATSLNKKYDKLTDGREIVCDYDAYNCPSYSGKYPSRRLKSCKDVKRVWDMWISDRSLSSLLEREQKFLEGKVRMMAAELDKRMKADELLLKALMEQKGK